MALRTINQVEIRVRQEFYAQERARDAQQEREREKTKSPREFAVKLNETKLALRKDSLEIII